MVSDGLACCFRCCPGCAVILGCTFCNAQEGHYFNPSQLRMHIAEQFKEHSPFTPVPWWSPA